MYKNIRNKIEKNEILTNNELKYIIDNVSMNYIMDLLKSYYNQHDDIIFDQIEGISDIYGNKDCYLTSYDLLDDLGLLDMNIAFIGGGNCEEGITNRSIRLLSEIEVKDNLFEVLDCVYEFTPNTKLEDLKTVEDVLKSYFMELSEHWNF